MYGEVSLPTSGVRVELFVRSSVPAVAHERQTVTVERLRRLADTDRIEGVAVRTWEKRVPMDEDAIQSRTHRSYAAFADWARERGVALHPFFDTRECYSSVTGESHTALVLPVMCLAVYSDDRLRAVFPYASEDRAYTVGDALDALAAERGHSRSTTVPVAAD